MDSVEAATRLWPTQHRKWRVLQVLWKFWWPLWRHHISTLWGLLEENYFFLPTEAETETKEQVLPLVTDSKLATKWKWFIFLIYFYFELRGTISYRLGLPPNSYPLVGSPIILQWRSHSYGIIILSVSYWMYPDIVDTNSVDSYIYLAGEIPWSWKWFKMKTLEQGSPVVWWKVISGFWVFRMWKKKKAGEGRSLCLQLLLVTSCPTFSLLIY